MLHIIEAYDAVEVEEEEEAPERAVAFRAEAFQAATAAFQEAAAPFQAASCLVAVRTVETSASAVAYLAYFLS